MPGKKPPRVKRTHLPLLYSTKQGPLCLPSSQQMRPDSSHSHMLTKRARTWSSRVPGVQGSPKAGEHLCTLMVMGGETFLPSLPLSTAGCVYLLWGRVRDHQERGLRRSRVAEIGHLYTSAGLNLRDRVLGEVEKNRFIALPGTGGQSGLMPSKLCVPPRRGW